MVNKTKLDKIWNKGTQLPGLNPAILIVDCYGNPILYNHYGKKTKVGWDIDHIVPKSKGGSNKLENLQPLQFEANSIKSDKLTKNKF